MRQIEVYARRAELIVALFARDSEVLGRWLEAGLRPDVALVGYDRDLWSTSCSASVNSSRRLLRAATPVSTTHVPTRARSLREMDA